MNFYCALTAWAVCPHRSAARPTRSEVSSQSRSPMAFQHSEPCTLPLNIWFHWELFQQPLWGLWSTHLVPGTEQSQVCHVIPSLKLPGGVGISVHISHMKKPRVRKAKECDKRNRAWEWQRQHAESSIRQALKTLLLSRRPGCFYSMMFRSSVCSHLDWSA